ncbi:hypothetical protein [Sporosarcina sp. FSL K6-1508]|uniref:hypothetical protein n=1 Tax=Sporosarcina sp. FSL K6-1508 TaxID=2921553 RepID=UPI0030F6F8EC
MTYIKPICDCQNELILTVHETDSMNFHINKKGNLIKSSVKHFKETHGTELACTQCGNTYVCEFDIEKRLIRGGVDREGFD